MRETRVRTIAGMPLMHEIDREWPWRERDWPGSRTTEEPVVIRHVVAPTNAASLRSTLSVGSWSEYCLDEDGNEVVRFPPVPAFAPSQTLATVRPGREYVIRYERAPEDAVVLDGRDMTITIISLASRGRGVLLHAAGFLLESGDGIACPGLSGAGKSTLSRLLREAGAPVRLLSDDRLVVTRDGPGLRLWGTPWAGEMQIAAPLDGPLRALVFIGRGDAISLHAITPREAARRLLAVLSLPLWNTGRFGRVLELVDLVALGVPSYEFSYPPRAEAAAWLAERMARELADG